MMDLDSWRRLPLQDQAAYLAGGCPPPEGAGIFGLSIAPDQARVVLIPVPIEATVSYGGGTGAAPAALVPASHQLDLEDGFFDAPYRHGLAMADLPPDLRETCRRAAESAPAARAGDAAARAAVDAHCDRVRAWVQDEAARHLDAGRIAAVVGGDHSAPLGLLEALGARYEAFGILHVDAHFDLRAAYEGFTFSHASIMHNVLARVPQVDVLVQVGMRDFCRDERLCQAALGARGVARTSRDLHRRKAHGEGWLAQAAELVGRLPPKVYISFDIDGLDPALCPHTGTPVPGGLGFEEAAMLIEEVAASGREVIGFDLCEIAPDPGGGDWDLNVGARVLYKLCGAALAG